MQAYNIHIIIDCLFDIHVFVLVYEYGTLVNHNNYGLCDETDSLSTIFSQILGWAYCTDNLQCFSSTNSLK